jgi:hypothetical protein
MLYDNGWFDGKDFHSNNPEKPLQTAEERLMWSDEPRIWRPLCQSICARARDTVISLTPIP